MIRTVQSWDNCFDASVDKEAQLLWSKPGTIDSLTFVGRTAIAFNYNFFITIYNIEERSEKVYIANNVEKGEGVQALTGARNLDIWAFADKSIKARIFVLKYPSFEKICMFKENYEVSYIALAMNDTENVLSLTGSPHYELSLWSWRTGRNLGRIRTGIVSDLQTIRFSPLNHNLVAHLAVRKGTNILSFWDIFSVKKDSLILKKDVKQDPNVNISSYCFSPEGNLHVIDKTGNIYFMSKENYTTQLMIKHDHRPGIIDKEFHYRICWFKGGLLKTTRQSHLQHYKRLKPHDWVESWKIDIGSTVKFLITTYMRDYAIAWTLKNEVWKISTKTDVALLTNYGLSFELVKILNPIGDAVVATSKNNVSVWKCDSGKFTGQMYLPDKVVSLDCHPFMRVVGLGLANGSIIMVVVENETYEPAVLSKFYLASNPICEIRFFRDGKNFVAATFDPAKIYVLKDMYGEQSRVLNHVSGNYKIIAMKICYYKEENTPDIIVLCQTSPGNPFAGDLLVSYRSSLVVRGKVALRQNVVDFEPIELGKFFVIIQASMLLYSIFCNFNEGEILRIEGLQSGHEVRKFNILSNDNFFYTFGWDGMVVVHTAGFETATGRIETLSYLEHGVKYACLSNGGHCVTVIGKNGALACYSFLKEEDLPKERRSSVFEDFSLGENFIPVEFPQDGSVENNWTKTEDDVRLMAEEKKYSKEVKSIEERLKMFRVTFVSALNANLELPEDEQLDINEFDLDIEARESRLEDASMEREIIRMDFEKTINDCNNMALLIIKECWDKMEKQTRVIKGIGAHFEVQSYGLLPEDKVWKEAMQRKSLRMDLNKKVVDILNVDKFYPWIPKEIPVNPSDENLKKIVRILSSHLTEEEQQDLDLQRKFEYSGSTSYKYIELPWELETQITFFSALQSIVHSVLFQKVQFDLQNYFNKKFDEMFKRKEFEMISMLQRNNRLRVILYEMEHSCKRPPIDEKVPDDPKWTFEEIPENLTRVQDYEVKALPYISPSMQKLIDERLAEEERIRLLLAADNFRELALIEMMDGVLEVRWEDELKKEVEKPACMLEKDPENFNEQDLIAIRDWEDKVKERIEDRERYYKMLEQEFKKNTSINNDYIAKFDNELYDLFLLKLNVESAVNQEMLKMLRVRRFNYKLFMIGLQEREIIKKCKTREAEYENTSSLFEKVKVTHRDCKANYESLAVKDKRMERQFKTELNKANVMPAHIDHLLKLFKRRPKLIHQTPPYRALFEDTSQLVTSLSGRLSILKEYHVPQEFYDFFQTLENLDVQPAGSPNIDDNIWQRMVGTRRKKIESEFKVKAAEFALNDADKTLNKFVKDIESNLKAYDPEGGTEKIRELRREEAEMQHNFQIQLVLKQGQVEQHVSGHVLDFDGCILINRYIIDTINHLILEAGKKKIDAMYACADFHRGIILKEWEHKRLRMEIEDLEKELHLVKTTKITNDIKQYLRRVAVRGEPTMKELLTVEKESKEIKLLNYHRKKSLKEMSDQLKSVEARHTKAKRDHKKIEKQIKASNIEASAIHHYRSSSYEATSKHEDERRMELIVIRSQLVKNVQKLRCDIIQLQTELELIRLKTYPTLKYKSLI